MTELWFGIKREKIEWFPIIDYEKCVGCLACVKKCKHGVYSVDDETKKPVVADKLKCIVGCTGCEKTCPARAISHQPINALKELARRKGVSWEPSCCDGGK